MPLIFGDVNMAVFSIIKLSELEGAKRIDADYYQPEFELIKRSLKKTGEPLGNLISYIKHPTEIKRIYETKGVPYILAENIHGNFWILQFTEKRYIAEEVATQIPENRLEVSDVLLTRTGANFGDACVYLEEPYPAYASAHIIIIRPSKIPGEYLATFFNTWYGKKLIKRGWYGSSQPEISPTYLVTLPIPQLGIENEITSIVRNAHDLYRRSQFLYSQAENLLLEELGLKDFKPKYEKTYTAKLSDAFSAHRIDAEYFQPAYEEVVEKLREKNIELKPLRKFILSIQKGIEPGSENYQDEGKPFIRVSNLSINGFTDRDQKYLSEELYQQLRETYEPKQGDFLLTKDATPGIAYVVKETIEGIIASGILKLQINESEINKEYLALCINSLIGKMQIERDGGGSVIIHWKPEQVKKLKIPLLPLSTQQKIASLVQQSHEARRKAKELLEVAKKAVETAIERNEKEALDYISKTEEE